MPLDLRAGIVRILHGAGGTVGTGFVVSADGLIATCAHVVRDAGPGDTIDLVFHATGDEGRATVEPAWWTEPGAQDVAILRIEGRLPEGVAVLRLGSSAGAEGLTLDTYGFPDAKPVEGLPGRSEVLGRTEEGGHPVLAVRSPEISNGFSGAPAWDPITGFVLGMATSLTRPDDYGRQTQTAFLVPSDTLIQVCPRLDLIPAPQQEPDGAVHHEVAQPRLAQEWFLERLEDAVAAAGPRYSPELSVGVPIAQSFEAFGRTPLWDETHRRRVERVSGAYERWTGRVAQGEWHDRAPSLPAEAEGITAELNVGIEALIEQLSETHRAERLNEVAELAMGVQALAMACEHLLVSALEEEHGRGAADSIGFRQFMAEIRVSHPAQLVDSIRELATCLDDLAEWLRRGEVALPMAPAMLVLGTAGAGKTHAICDAAVDRHRRGLRSLVVLGEQVAEGEPWRQIRELVGLGAHVSRDDLLAMLNAAGEASRYPLIIFIDALNEATPRAVWRTYLTQMVEQVRRYEWLKLCLSCRTSYRDGVMPDGLALPEVVHNGFEGVEFEALPHFFDFFRIELPSAPLLQPEFSNPLFLKLVCQSLHDEGQHRLPDQELSIGDVVRLLLESKNKKISEALDHDRRGRLVHRAMDALVGAMVEARANSLLWAHAKELVDKVGPAGARATSLFHHMVREGLLAEDRIIDPGSSARS